MFLQKIKTYLLAGLMMINIIAVPALAAADIGLGNGGLTQDVANNGGYDTVGVKDTTLSETIGRIIRIVLSLVGTIFFSLTVYAGILWMIAQGNDEQVLKAKNILRMAVIGLIITLASYGITAFVLIGVVGAARNATCVGAAC